MPGTPTTRPLRHSHRFDQGNPLAERNTPTARILQEHGVTRDRVMDGVRSLRGGKPSGEKPEDRLVHGHVERLSHL